MPAQCQKMHPADYMLAEGQIAYNPEERACNECAVLMSGPNEETRQPRRILVSKFRAENDQQNCQIGSDSH